MRVVKARRRLNVRTFSRASRIAAAVAAAVGFVAGPAAQAGHYYWTGASAGDGTVSPSNPALWTSTTGGTNWSTSPISISDPGTAPPSGSNVFFAGNGALNYNYTALGADFSLNSLTFTSTATGPIGIGGTNTLIIGAGGITALSGSGSANIGANVSIGTTAQTWTDNNATSSETIGGTFTAGDVITTVVDGVTVSYTVQSSDTNLSGVAIGIANAINSNAQLAGLVNATSNGAIVNISGYQGVPALSSSVTGTETATVATGSAITVSGNISGSAPLTLAGTGSTLTPSGQFIFSGANSYSGVITLLNANTSLTVGGNGTLSSAAGLNLGGGTVFTLDNTGTNLVNRLAGTLPVNSNGGTINLLGSSSAASADQIGALTLKTGLTNVNVTPGAGNTATLTIANLNRLAGAGVNFSSTGNINLTNPGSLPNGIIGPWATIGNLNNNGNLDFATVSAGQVVAYSGYDTNVTDLTNGGTAFSSANIKLTSGTAVMSASGTVNTLYMTGTAGLQIGAVGATTPVLTLGAGGIIANGGTTNYSLGNGQAEIYNATWIGGPAFSGGTAAATNTENQGGDIAVGAGVPDLVITVGGTSNPVSGVINGALQLNVKNILNTATPLGTATATTTSGSTTVTLTSGTTANLYPGVAVTGLTGTGVAGTTQYVVSIIDSTHFTIGNAPTASGAAATATFTGNTGLTKDGNGLLDIGDGNANNKTVAYSFLGPVTVNGGILLIGNDANLGVAPLSFNPAAIVLNGGELRSTAGLTFAANRGITVGPQGGTISYVGGSTLTLSQKITGPGGITFNGDSYNTAGGNTFNISNTTQDNYQGPTIVEVKNASTMNVTTANPLPPGTALTLSLPPNFVSGTNGNALPVNGFGTFEISSSGLTIGSLSSSVTSANVTGNTATTTLTIGGTSANPVTQNAIYNGIITNKTGDTLSVVKNGGGNQIFTGASTYGGTTTINGGAIVAENATGSATGTGNVTVAIGGTLGSGLNVSTGTHTGIIGGNVTVQSGGTLQPTVVGNTASSLQISGTTGLTLNGGSILNFDLGAVNSGTGLIAAPTSDNVYVSAGNLTVGTGTDVINIIPLSGFGVGTYQLITAAGVPANFNGTNFIVNGSLQFAYSVVDDTANKSLDLTVIVNPNPALTWLGAPGNGTWNTDPNNKAWTFTGGSGTSAYQDGSNVTFDNTPGQSATISIPSNVAPGSLTFNNNALVSYTFNGAGAITGAIGFTMENVGTVTFNNVNTFTAEGSVQAGTVIVGATGALADTSIGVSSGAALTVNGALTAPGLSLNNAGTLTVGSTGSIPVGTALTDSGTAIFNNPSVTLSALSNGGAPSASIVLNGTRMILDQSAPAAPPWSNFSGTGTLELNPSTVGDYGIAGLTAGFTGTLQIDAGHVASDAAGAAFGGASAIVIGAGQTAGAGGQLDLTALLGNFGPALTLGGSGYGTGLQGASLLLGSTTVTNLPGVTVTPVPTVATYGTTTVTGSVNLAGNATIASNGIGIISGSVSGGSLTAGTSGGPTANNGVAGYPLLLLSSTAGNTYTGTTTVNNGTLQFAHPQDLYNGNSASWTAANILVDSGATLALNVGGPNDFTAAQAGTVLSNLNSGTTTGWQPGSAFGVDTNNATTPVTLSTPFIGAGVWKAGAGTLNLTATANNYSGPTSVTDGPATGSVSTLILNGSNTGHGLVSVTNTTVTGTTVLAIRNANALGSGTANSGLAPINMDAYGTVLSASILEIGATIGTDPGGNNADFSYQLVEPEANQIPTNIVLANGQISLGILGNSDDGTGFAAYNPTGAPRVVALYEDPNETYEGVQGNATTLATIEQKYAFGLGGGDHLTMGSSTSNTTLVLLNPVDLQGGPQRRFASIRGVGIVPEGEYSGAISNSAGTALNLSFDGNGGLVFDSVNSSFSTATIQVNGGAIFVAADDPAQPGTNGALGQNATTLQIGTSTAVNPGGGTAVPTTAGANLGFMTFGPDHGIGSTSPTVVTARNITVGGTGVNYASVILGGASNDYTAMNGNILLNGNLGSATPVPTTFFARNGGRVDFGGVISGTGSVAIGGNSVVVEGDANTPGISLANNGAIVFNGANTYTGSTTVATGKLYINGGNGNTNTNVSPLTVQSSATLGGMGTVNAPVTITAGGNLEAGQAGAGAFTLNGNLSFTGAGAIDYVTVQGSLNGPALMINGNLVTNSNTVTIDVIGAINPGNYALLDYANVQPSTFTLATLPSRASGSLVVNPNNPNELDLDVTSSGGALLWTGSQSTAWDTSTTNWVLQGSSTPIAYIDNPGDAVIFDDTADPRTSVTINGADVHPGSVTFNNSSSGTAYTISGSNAIAGSTGLTLGGNGGTVILLNTNTFTGPTVINSGTLQLGNGTPGHDGSISTTSSITDNGALVYNIAGAQTYGGMITGSGSLTVQGAGILTLTNSGNNFSGGTIVTAGTLQLGTGTVNNDGALTGNVTDNGTLAFDYNGNVTMAGAITGKGAVTKSGPGALTLTNDGNSFSGPLTIDQGALIITGFGNDPSGANIGGVGTGLITIDISGTLELNPGSTGNNYNLANNVVFNGGALFSPGGQEHIATGPNQTINVGANGGTIQTQNNTQDVYLDGLLSGTGPLGITNVGNASNGSLTTVHVTNNANPYPGVVTVNGASGMGVQLEIDANNALQFATVNVIGTSSSGSTLQFGSSVANPTFGALSGNGSFSLPGVALTVGGNNGTTTYSGVISGNGSFTKAGTGTLTLTNANTYSGNTYITGGTLKLTGSAGLNEGIVATNYATTTGFPSPAPAVSSWTQVTIQPTARWGTSTNNGGANVYPSWGNTTIWGYAGYIDNTSTIPVTYTFGKNFDDGAYLQIDGNVVINDNTFGDTVTSNITLTPGLHTIDLLFGQGTGGVGPTGPNYGSFGVAYNTVGNTATSGTWLQVGPTSSNTSFFAANLGQVPSTSSVILSSNTTFDVSGTNGATVSIGSLADAAGNPTGHQVLLGSSALITGSDNTSTQFSGVISGAGGSLFKTGTGAFTLAGANTYTGGTLISGGTLLARNTTGSATGTAPVNVGDSSNANGFQAVLGGTGTVSAVNVFNGSTISAGTNSNLTPSVTSAIGKLTTGQQTWYGGGNYTWKLNNASTTGGTAGTPGGDWDVLSMSTFVLDPSTGTTPFQIVAQTLNGNVNNFNQGQTYVWEIAHAGDGSLANLSANQLAQNLVLNVAAISSATNTSPANYSLVTQPDSSGSELDVVYSPAPEPTSLALGAMAAGGLLLRRRRREN